MPVAKEYLAGKNRTPSGDTAPPVRVRVKTFKMPPIYDGVVIGVRAPVNRASMLRALKLITREPYAALNIQDETVASVIVRRAILKKVMWEQLSDIVIRNIKPLMTEQEMISLHLEIELDLVEAF